jgi:two-component system, NarL family, invasion response regulator UvrY
MITVLVADDHAIVRHGIKQILATAPEIETVIEASNGHELLAKLRLEKVDVVLLDITMPGRSGLDILTHIKYEQPRLPVLILSVHAEELYGARVLRSGACGYLMKDTAPDQLVAAVRKAASGGRYISPTLAERLVAGLDSQQPPAAHEKLSDREYDVLRMIALGKTIQEIANQWSLSEKTISGYQTRILKKLNMRKKGELTHYAIRAGLVD